MTHLHLTWANALAGGLGGTFGSLLALLTSRWLRRRARLSPEALGKLTAFDHPEAVAVAELLPGSLSRGVVRCICSSDGRVLYSGAIDDCSRFARAHNGELRRIRGDQA